MGLKMHIFLPISCFPKHKSAITSVGLSIFKSMLHYVAHKSTSVFFILVHIFVMRYS